MLEILNSWYKVLDGNESKQQPTYFTKADILGENVPTYNKIKVYGIYKYLQEVKTLESYRNTLYLKLLVHILNKTK